MNETLRDYNDFDQTVFRTTPEGYLTGKIRVTGAGVFSYMTADGIKRRLRPVKEVSSQDSIDSLNSKPVTLLHPMQDVSPENAKKLQVGFTGTDASWDGLNAYVTMTITDAEAIKEMREGRVRAVSCGYDAGLERGKGNWQGVAYDEAMKDIRYNHIALVREGRAGDGVRFRIGDSADFDRIFSEKRTAQNGPGENRMARKLIIDGAEYEADEKVIDTLHAAQKARDEAQQQSKALQGQLDSMTAARDAALSERDQLKAKAKDEATINQLVNEKVALLDNAKKFGVEVKATDSVDSIRSALVKSAYPEMVLDGKSVDYIAAAYDAAMIKLADSTSPKDKKSPLAPNMTHMADGADPEEAFQAMNKKYSEVSIKKEG